MATQSNNSSVGHGLKIIDLECIERKCIKRNRALKRPGGSREHSGKIRLEGSNSEEN